LIAISLLILVPLLSSLMLLFPKPAARTSAIEGIADLAIRRKRAFVSGKF